MINSPVGAAPTFKDPFELEPLASAQAAARKEPIKDRRFAFAVDRMNRVVLFDYGLRLEGVWYSLIARLTDQLIADKKAGKPPACHLFVRTKTLLVDLKVEEHTLLQRIRRMRKTLERHFLATIDYMPDPEDVVQSKRWYGYRLNPYLALVNPAEIRAHEMS
jgi:hypothetical protein